MIHWNKARFSWLVASTLALAAPGCKRAETTSTGPEPAASASAPLLEVHFTKIQAQKLPPVLEITGTLDPDEKSDVAAQFGGAVKQVLVDVGTRVKKGDVLAVLDSSEAALRLASAKATADAQRARLGLKKDGSFDPENIPDVKAAREQRDLAKKEADRVEQLAKQGAVAQSAADEARTAAERSQAQYESTKNSMDQGWSALKAAEAQTGLSGKNLKDTKIVAPFEGAVVEKRVSVGEWAQVGRVIAVVVKDNPLRLRIDVPETELGGLSPNAAVSLRVAAFPNREFAGSVKRIGASMSVASRTLPVEAEVPNEEGVLKPGFFVRAQVSLTGEAKDVLLVDEKALGNTGSNARVFVREGGHVIEKLVSTGRHVGELVEIRGQIALGDEVAIDNVDKLSDSLEVAAK